MTIVLGSNSLTPDGIKGRADAWRECALGAGAKATNERDQPTVIDNEGNTPVDAREVIEEESSLRAEIGDDLGKGFEECERGL